MSQGIIIMLFFNLTPDLELKWKILLKEKNLANTLNVDKHDFTMHDIGKYEVVSFDKHGVHVM